MEESLLEMESFKTGGQSLLNSDLLETLNKMSPGPAPFHRVTQQRLRTVGGMLADKYTL